jgi:hypothetical protein
VIEICQVTATVLAELSNETVKDGKGERYPEQAWLRLVGPTPKLRTGGRLVVVGGAVGGVVVATVVVVLVVVGAVVGLGTGLVVAVGGTGSPEVGGLVVGAGWSGGSSPRAVVVGEEGGSVGPAPDEVGGADVDSLVEGSGAPASGVVIAGRGVSDGDV